MFLLAAFGIAACKHKKKSKESRTDANIISATLSGRLPFNLEAPDKKFVVPEVLHEISGIAAVNDSIIACIADEKGTVYFFNLNTIAVDHKLKFADKGDFEDLTIYQNTLYVLDSKGVVWTIQNYLSDNPQVTSTELGIEEPFELEGLCQRDDTLFIAAKYYHNKKRDQAGLLPVWRLNAGMKAGDPLFNVSDFIESTRENIAVPFHTSALLFDESLQQWFCLSTHTKAFIQCDYRGNILKIQALSEKEFSQPEGLCFTKNGDLLISNEGRDGAGNILLFKHLK